MAKIKNFNIKKLRTEEDFGFQKRIEAETSVPSDLQSDGQEHQDFQSYKKS